MEEKLPWLLQSSRTTQPNPFSVITSSVWQIAGVANRTQNSSTSGCNESSNSADSCSTAQTEKSYSQCLLYVRHCTHFTVSVHSELWDCECWWRGTPCFIITIKVSNSWPSALRGGVFPVSLGNRRVPLMLLVFLLLRKSSVGPPPPPQLETITDTSLWFKKTTPDVRCVFWGAFGSPVPLAAAGGDVCCWLRCTGEL